MKTQILKPNVALKRSFPRYYNLKQKWTLALGLVAATVLVPAKTSAQTAWTGTWGVTPQSGGNTFNNQTIRQIVYTSVGGSTARIRLSNLFGSQSVLISDVHIALAGAGSSIQAGTDHVVTFGGAGSVTIGAKAEVSSDSTPMTIPSLSEVAISFYLPNSTSVQTYHQFSFQTVYVANGDVSGSTNLSVASTPSSYFFLTNLDVQSPALTGAVVTFGASITDGFASTQNANHRWPNFLARRLSAAGIDVGVINQGVSGNQLLNNNNTLSALNRFQHDAIGQPNVRWVIFSDDPINDVGNNHSITGAQLITGVKQLISQAHSNGLKFLGSTLTPFKGASYWSSAGETAREQFNAFVLSPSSGCDGVIDQDAATHDPSNPTQYLPAFDSGDHLHPNDAGYQAIANAVNLNFFGTPQTQTEAPFGGTPAAIPGTIQNENYDTGGEGLAYHVTSINGTGNSYRSDGVDLETTSDTGDGFDLGWTSSGQWFKYTVNVTTAGTYSVSFRVASVTAVGTNAGSFHLQTPSGTNLSGAINVPGTGGWQTWTTITASVTLPAGQQILELFEDNGGYNFNYMAFTSGGQAVAAPVFSPGGGTYSSAQNITITTSTGGASIRYTTDGSTPTETAGTIYSGPVNIAATTTLNAIAYESGLTDSTITSGTYTITSQPPTGIEINSGGPAVSPFVADKDFTGGGTIDHANTINTSKVTNPAPAAVYQSARVTAAAGAGTTFSYTIGGFTAGSSNTVRLHFCETFHTTAGSRVFNVSINGTQVLTNFDIFATAGGQNIANIQEFTEAANSSGQYVILFTTAVDKALISGIEINSTTAPPPAAAPSFSPAGGTYSSAQNVAITTTTGGASIRHTSDGSTPSGTVGTIYSGPVNISSNTTLKAIAYASGFTDSSITFASRTITTPPPPVIVGATTPFVSYEAEAGAPGSGAAMVSLTSPPPTQFSSPELKASATPMFSSPIPATQNRWSRISPGRAASGTGHDANGAWVIASKSSDRD